MYAITKVHLRLIVPLPDGEMHVCIRVMNEVWKTTSFD